MEQTLSQQYIPGKQFEEAKQEGKKGEGTGTRCSARALDITGFECWVEKHHMRVCCSKNELINKLCSRY